MMKTSEKVLLLLEAKRGEFVSGEILANQLNLTRAAIWRAVNTLRSAGYKIVSSTKKGYMLHSECDRLSAQGIMNLLKAEVEVLYRESVDSTNTEAKRLALQGLQPPFVVVADTQIKGKGRGGKAFHSPRGSGLYLSLLIKPDLTTLMALRVTAAAAVATSRAIKAVTGKEVEIKWVNDLFYQEKKICGILTEGAAGFENGKLESVVIGIGLNYRTPEGGFPQELHDIAVALFDTEVPLNISRNLLAASIIDHLMTLLKELDAPSFMDEYRRRSNVLGKAIKVYQGKQQFNATVKTITDDGALIVSAEDGTEHALNSGEISIRKG